MFGVRLVADPSVRMNRRRKCSPDQWSWASDDASPGEDLLTLDTTDLTPTEVADLIIKHSGISAT